jgi:hypothetical protein
MRRSSSRRRSLRSAVPWVVALACLVLAACAGSDQTRTAGGIEVGVKTHPSPAELGENDFTFSVKAEGRPAADAAVTFRMHMPGMEMSDAAAWRSTDSEGGGRYRGKGDFSMGGTWQVDVAVQRPGQAPVTVSFPYTIKWELK